MVGTLPLGLQEAEAIQRRINPRLARWQRRCAPCDQVGGGAQHGLCTDPHGKDEHCYCCWDSDLHRERWGLWTAQSHGEESGYDGGLGSRSAIDRREWEEEKHYERTIERG